MRAALNNVATHGQDVGNTAKAIGLLPLHHARNRICTLTVFTWSMATARGGRTVADRSTYFPSDTEMIEACQCNCLRPSTSTSSYSPQHFEKTPLKGSVVQSRKLWEIQADRMKHPVHCCVAIFT